MGANFCPGCARPAAPDHQFCGGCGSGLASGLRLDPPRAEAQPAPPPPVIVQPGNEPPGFWSAFGKGLGGALGVTLSIILCLMLTGTLNLQGKSFQDWIMCMAAVTKVDAVYEVSSESTTKIDVTFGRGDGVIIELKVTAGGAVTAKLVDEQGVFKDIAGDNVMNLRKVARVTDAGRYSLLIGSAGRSSSTVAVRIQSIQSSKEDQER